MPIVRMDGFTLEGEGVELFKDSFRKLLSQKWNSFEKQFIRKSVFQKHKAKTIAPEKQSVVSQK